MNDLKFDFAKYLATTNLSLTTVAVAAMFSKQTVLEAPEYLFQLIAALFALCFVIASYAALLIVNDKWAELVPKLINTSGFIMCSTVAATVLKLV